MKVLLQRVTRASVRVGGESVAEIGEGALVFVCVERGDGERDVVYHAKKVAELRIFADEDGKMNRSLTETGGAALVVSQFTLAASTRRGRRPSYSRAADPAEGERLYEAFAERLAALGVPVRTGRFRAMMEVSLVNDGPVTLWLDPPPFRDGESP